MSKPMMKRPKAASGKHWIQGAIKRKGALTKKATAAGQSPMQFAQSHKSDSGRTGRQARLALTLRKMNKK